MSVWKCEHVRTHTAKHTTSITYTCAHKRYARTAFRAIRSSHLNTKTTLHVYYYTSTTYSLQSIYYYTSTTILLTIYLLPYFYYYTPYNLYNTILLHTHTSIRVQHCAQPGTHLISMFSPSPKPPPRPSPRPPLLFLTPSFLRLRGGRSHPKHSHFFFFFFSLTDH
jgi:hypothetical protein